SYGVYFCVSPASLPPSGSIIPSACSPASVLNLGNVLLLPGNKITLKVNPPRQCTDPAAVDGANWTLKAVADVHADDFGSCATLAQVFSSDCSLDLSDDDDNNANNTPIRAP